MMRVLRVSFFCCGLVFAAGVGNLFAAIPAERPVPIAVNVAFMLVSFGFAVWGESRADADARELAQYRRQELANSPRSSRSFLN